MTFAAVSKSRVALPFIVIMTKGQNAVAVDVTKLIRNERDRDFLLNYHVAI